MIFGLLGRNGNRKDRLCRHCKEYIDTNTDNLMLVMLGKKGGRYFLYFHTGCLEPWTLEQKRKRAERLKERKGGRPTGSSVKDLREQSPELAAKREWLVRRQARLIRYILNSEDKEKIRKWKLEVEELRGQISEILPFQVKKPGRRTNASIEMLSRKTGWAVKPVGYKA